MNREQQSNQFKAKKVSKVIFLFEWEDKSWMVGVGGLGEAS